MAVAKTYYQQRDEASGYGESMSAFGTKSQEVEESIRGAWHGKLGAQEYTTKNSRERDKY